MGRLGLLSFLMAGENVANILTNTGDMVQAWGAPIMMCVGAILVVVAIVKIAKGLMSHGQGQVNWVLNIACLLIGALLLVASTGMFDTLKKTGNTINKDVSELLGSGGAIVLNVD